MGLHAYCIAPLDSLPPPGTRGIGDAPVTGLATRGFCVWCSQHGQPPGAGIEQLRAHDRVVRAAMSDRITPVPLRFNQWFAAEDELASRLGARAGHWQALLEHFAGTLEMGLRLSRLEPVAVQVLLAGRTATSSPAHLGEETAAGAGREYLEHLRAEGAARTAAAAGRDELLARLADFAGPAVAAARCDPVPDREGLWRVAHLVRHARLAAYEEAVGELRRRYPSARILLTGPWPPYSFAADAE